MCNISEHLNTSIQNAFILRVYPERLKNFIAVSGNFSITQMLRSPVCNISEHLNTSIENAFILRVYPETFKNFIAVNGNFSITQMLRSSVCNISEHLNTSIENAFISRVYPETLKNFIAVNGNFSITQMLRGSVVADGYPYQTKPCISQETVSPASALRCCSLINNEQQSKRPTWPGVGGWGGLGVS